MSKIRLLFLAISILVISTIASCSAPNQVTYKQYKQAPPMTIDLNKKYTATIQTSKGNIVLELLPKEAPLTVNNFVFLARDGFYDNTTFFYVVPGFLAQAGDPTGTGSGGPGYTFPDEKNTLTHITGVVSMANRGQPDTNGSQFFITYSPQHHLDGTHTVFGRITQGMDVAVKLLARDPGQNPTYKGDTILKITVTEN